MKVFSRILGVLAAATAVVAFGLPMSALAQPEETISGTVTESDGHGNLVVRDAQGGVDRLHVSRATDVTPRGHALRVGMSILASGIIQNGVIEAASIDAGTEAGVSVNEGSRGEEPASGSLDSASEDESADNGPAGEASSGDSDNASQAYPPYAAPPYGYGYWNWAAPVFGFGFPYWGCCGYGATYYRPGRYPPGYVPRRWAPRPPLGTRSPWTHFGRAAHFGAPMHAAAPAAHASAGSSAHR